MNSLEGYFAKISQGILRKSYICLFKVFPSDPWDLEFSCMWFRHWITWMHPYHVFPFPFLNISPPKNVSIGLAFQILHYLRCVLEAQERSKNQKLQATGSSVINLPLGIVIKYREINIANVLTYPSRLLYK